MKTIAFICDNCGTVNTDEYIFSVIVEQPDLYKDAYTYSTNQKNEQNKYHCCLECYRRYVTDLLKGIDKGKDGEEYNAMYKIYAKKLFENVYRKALLRGNSKNKWNKKLL